MTPLPMPPTTRVNVSWRAHGELVRTSTASSSVHSRKGLSVAPNTESETSAASDTASAHRAMTSMLLLMTYTLRSEKGHPYVLPRNPGRVPGHRDQLGIQRTGQLQ